MQRLPTSTKVVVHPQLDLDDFTHIEARQACIGETTTS